jgi:hypothetical protein
MFPPGTSMSDATNTVAAATALPLVSVGHAVTGHNNVTTKLQLQRASQELVWVVWLIPTRVFITLLFWFPTTPKKFNTCSFLLSTILVNIGPSCLFTCHK